MPNYTFECTVCGKPFEKNMTIADYEAMKDKMHCDCGGLAKRTWIMTSLITHYACNGFYDTESKTGRFRVR